MMPPPKQRMPAGPTDWLIHAASDLKLARLGAEREVLPEQVCFHAQQAVEKTLKAVLLYARVEFPFTHDLEALLQTLTAAGVTVPVELLDVGQLTPYAVETRYPGYWGEISDVDVQEAIDSAEKALAWADAVVMDGVVGKGGGTGR